MVLVDTSAWISYFQNGNDQIKSLIDKKSVCTIDIVIMEFLQGVKNDKNHNSLKKWFLSLPNLTIKQEHYLKASEIYRGCRKKGVTVRKSIDCIIAAVAISNSVKLFGDDSDFENIAKLYKLDYQRV